MDKAGIAILIAGGSAIAAGLSAFFTWRQSHLTKKSMKRKQLTMTPSIADHPNREGWQVTTLHFRNFEPHEAKITGIRAKRRSGLLEIDRSQTKKKLPPARDRSLNIRMSPAPANPVSLVLMTQGVHSAKDLNFTWHWSDGEPI